MAASGPWHERELIKNVLVAVASVIVAIVIAQVTERLMGMSPQVSVLLCAIMFVAWARGVGAAMLATVLAVLSFDYFFLEPAHTFHLELRVLPRLGFFAIAALFIVMLSAAHQRAADSLRRARDEQRAMVRELQRLNESLRLENAERQRAEQKASAAERELQTTIDTIPALVATYEADGSRGFMNKRARDITGLAPEDLASGRWKTAIHPDDIAPSETAWHAAIASGEPYEFEYRLRGADGEFRSYAARRVPLRNAKGEIVRWYGISHDIEDRKRAEQALRVSEARLAEAERDLQLMIDMISAVITCYRPDGERDFVNKPWRDYTGVTLKDIQEGRWRSVVHPDDQEESDRRWNASLATGEPFTFEQRLLRHDGEYRWHLVHRVPLRGADGAVLRWYGVGFDIEDRRRAEAALRESESRLAQAKRELELTVDSIPAFVTVFGPGGEREFVNKTWRDNTGLALDDVLHGNWRRIVHPDDQEMSERLWREAVATGQPLLIEQRIRRHDGEYRWHKGHRVPLRDDSGKIIRWYSIATDIEDQKRAEQAMRRSEAQLAASKRELEDTIDTIPTLISSYGQDGKRDFVNAAWKRYTGLSTEQSLGTEWFSTVHPDDVAEGDRRWRDALAKGERVQLEQRFRRWDGAYRWFIVDRVPLYDENGQVVKWYATGYDVEEQKRADAALRLSEAGLAEAKQELQATIDTIPALITSYWPDGSRDFANRAWQAFTGRSQDEIRGSAWMIPVHPDDLDATERTWSACLATGEPFELEHRFCNKDGEYRWHSVRRVPRRDETGRIVKWYSVGYDIEERKRAEAALRDSEARLAKMEHELRLTLDTIPSLTWRAGPNGYVQYLNRRWFEYTGTTPENARGARWQAAIHPDDLEALLNNGRTYVAAEQPIDSEARLRRYDGEYRWFLFRPAPLRDENGKVLGWYGTITDIEDRKRAESALQRSEAYLAEAQKVSRTGAFGWDIADGSFFWSEQTYDISGYDRSELPSLERIMERTHPDDRTMLHHAFECVLQGGGTLDLEHRLLLPGGEIKHLRVLGHRAKYVTGKEELVGAVVDITEMKRAQEALQAAQADLAHASRVATLGEISASIAHEVNQPLAAIVANGQACLRFLRRETPDLNDVRGTVEWMVKDGNRASEVIRRLRALMNKSEPQLLPLDLNDVLNEVVGLLQRELSTKRVSVRLDLAPGLPPAVADRIQLQQVIINLVMNGIEAMNAAEHRELTIRSREGDDGEVVAAVVDRGTGIGEDSPDRLFQAFFTTKAGGLGMGLSICRSIMEAHGGRIWASANAGAGATFQFSLPAVRESLLETAGAMAEARAVASMAAPVH